MCSADAGLAPGRGRRRGAVAWRWLRRALALAAGLYAIAMAALWWGQERLIFHPDPLPAGALPMAGDALPPDVQAREIAVPGATLSALHLKQPGARALVFFLHGNAGNLRSWFVDLDRYRSLGVDLFMLDYRGYGLSTGRIESEAQLQADVRAAWEAVVPEYAGRPVVLYGRSLGTGLAAALAAGLPPAERPPLLMLVSPYRSLEALAGELYPMVPSALLRYPLRTDRALAALAGGPPRVLLLHGDRDGLIPIAHSEALLRGAPGATLVRVPGAGHGDIHRDPVYREAVREAIASVLVPDGAVPASTRVP